MVFFQACSLQNEVGDPIFFTFLTQLTHHLTVVKSSEKNQCWKIFARMSLKTSLFASLQEHALKLPSLMIGPVMPSKKLLMPTTIHIRILYHL